MTWRTLAVVSVIVWLAAALGARWGVAAAEREREVVAEQRVPAAPPTLRHALRCSQTVTFTNRNEPVPIARVWSLSEAEARYHHAAMWLRAAEESGVWSDRGRRAVMLAVGQLLEVLVCAPP